MKDKPHKFGIKIWMANCSVTGYCYDFKVYEGAGDVFDQEPQNWVDEWSLVERVVLNLAAGLPPKSYIFTDRFFTTPRLCAYLATQEKYLSGTLMRNKMGIRKDILFKKSKNIPRGFYKFVIDVAHQNVTQICWMDRNPVSLCTSVFGPDRCPYGIQRLTVDLTTGTYRRRPMRAPMVAMMYNMYMGGTDRFDRLKLNRWVQI